MKFKKLLAAITFIAGLIPAMAQVPSYVPTSSLAAWYPFNGDATDESANSNDGTPTGTVLATDRLGNPNSAYYFNGSSYIGINTALGNFGTSDFSISAWVYKQNATAAIFGKRDASSHGNFVVFNSQLGFEIDESDPLDYTGFTEPVAQPQNFWFHTVLVREADEVRIYVNGTLTSTTSTGITQNINNTSMTLLGARMAGAAYAEQFLGLLDDIGVWTRVLTQAEITNLANACVSITTAGSSTGVSCNGGSNGTATVTPSGGVSPFTYSWAPSGGTSATATGLAAGTYTVTVTGADGCMATEAITVTQPAAVSGTTVVTNVACFSGSNGAINLTPNGGTGPYTYNWLPSGPTTEDRTGLVAGTYTVQVTDANACTGTVTATVTQPTSPVSGTTVVTNVACFSGSNGAINLTPNGGTGPYTYNWGSGVTTQDRTGLVAGTYTVVITDANACTGTVTATVTQPTSPVSGTTVVTNVACFSGSNGAINLTPNGGTGPYTYNWLPSGPTTEDRTGLVAGTYTVQVTDINGCTATVNATVTQPTSPVSGTTVVTNVACFSGSNGAINLTPNGGTGPYTYNWLPSGPTTEDRTGLVAATYTVQVTDINGCTGTINATVTQPTAPVSGTAVVTNVACFGGSNGAINLTPNGGTSPYTFNWGGGITTEDRTGLSTGTYTVIVTDANACTGTVTATVTEPASAVSGTTVVTNVACFSGSNGAINLTPNGGTSPYTFNWGGGVTTEDRTGLSAGTYTVIVTDANACTGTVTATVTEPASAVSGTTVVTNVACFSGSNGAINLTPNGGTSPYTFNWGGGITTEDRTGLSAGTYTVIVTDANACTGTVTATVTEPASAVSGSTVVTNVSCFSGSNGAINLTPNGGTSPYTFNWGGGITTEDRTGLSAGTYTVIVTDANACTGTVTATVTAPAAAVSGTTVVTNVACFGGSNGAINLTPNGGTSPYTFNWGAGVTTEDRTGLAAGTYTVVITDNNACTGTVTATVTAPAVVSGSTVVTNVSCFSGSNGTINLTPNGGTSPYTFNWGAGITTEDRTGLSAGTYTVIITDANACTGTVTATITAPAAAVSGSTVVTNVSCFSGSNGAINLTPNGGTSPYTFNWGAGITTEDRTGLAAGTYTVIITDNNGCTATVTATVTEPSAITAFGTSTGSTCGSANGTASVTASGGTGGYSYNWTPGTPTGDGTASISGLMAGSYTVTITDANGCSFSLTQVVNSTSGPSLSGTKTDVSCNMGSNGTASVTATGGTGPYTYSWAPSGGTASSASGLTAGTYTVTVTDVNGCVATQIFTINQPPAIVLSTASQTNVSCNGGSNGSVTVSATGGTGSFTYSWAPAGGTAATASGLAAGTYTVTVTDANACVATHIVSVTQPAALVAFATAQVNVSCNGGSNGSATVSATGGTGALTYSWAPAGGTAATASGLAAGTYTVTVTDANACIATQVFTITEPSALIASALAQSNVSCNGGSNGVASVFATGGTGSYTYLWTPSGGTASTAAGLAAGTYTATVTDANGCVATQVFNITEPAAITLTSVETGVSCNGGTGGSASVTATGGTGSFTYSWAPSGGTAATETGLAAGTYTVTVTDANSCTTTQVITITEPAALTASQTSGMILCNGGTTSVMISASGGTTPYTGIGTFTQSAGTTTYTVSDDNGCSTSISVSITEPAAIASSQTLTICSGSSVTVGSSVYNSTGMYTDVLTAANGCDSTVSTHLTVSPSISSMQTLTVCAGGSVTVGTNVYSTTGIYTDVLTAAGGCDSTVTTDLTVSPAITNMQTLTVCAGGSVTVGSNIYNTTGVYTDVLTAANGCDSTVTTDLTVNPAITASQTLTACAGGSVTVGSNIYNTTGTYTDILTAANGCDSTVTTNLTVNPAISGAQALTICSGSSITVGTSTYNASGTYTDVLTAANGCDSTVTTNLTVNTLPSVSIGTFTMDTICFQSSGITLPAGSPAGGVYSGPGVLPGIFNPSMAGVGVHSIVYTVTDANSCSNSATATITVEDCTGIEENANTLVAGLYPNPSTGSFNVQIQNANFEELQISIVDIQGKELYRSIDKSISGTFTKEINVTDLAKGIYYVKLNTGASSRVLKLVIQ